EIGALEVILLAVGTEELTTGAVTGAVTTVADGLLFGNILLALCSPESSEYVIVGCEATTALVFCAGFTLLFCAVTSAAETELPGVSGVPVALPTCSVWPTSRPYGACTLFRWARSRKSFPVIHAI